MIGFGPISLPTEHTEYTEPNQGLGVFTTQGTDSIRIKPEVENHKDKVHSGGPASLRAKARNDKITSRQGVLIVARGKGFCQAIYRITDHDLNLTRAVMGHANVSSTQGYLFVVETEMQNAVLNLRKGTSVSLPAKNDEPESERIGARICTKMRF